MAMQTFIAMRMTPIRKKEVEVVYFPQQRFSECPFYIMVPEHYREPKGCLCSNKAEREKMIREWGYKEADFKDIPLVD